MSFNPGSPTYSLSSASIDDPVVVIDTDDISNYNPDQILPESPEEIVKIREWLSPTDYSNDSGEYQRHLTSHLPGTGAWVTSSNKYLDWLQSHEAGILWIKGIPGSGKSVLAAHITDELARSHSGAPVLYFFFRQIIDANHKPDALLRDWLDQILDYSPPLQKRLKELIETGRSIESITMEDHWANLKLAFSGLVDKVFCVADALDEMDQGNDEFLRSLVNLGHWRPSKAKILMTSRPVPSVEAPLRQTRYSEIRLAESYVDIDIASYVEDELRKSKISESDQQRIKEAIPGRANGLFLYAKLAMDAFLEPDAPIDEILLNLPCDLHAMYTRILQEHARRSSVPSDVQLLILQWTTHATRPLRLLELAEMIDVTYYSGNTSDLKAKKELVRAATGPLLEILPDETVSVVHHSFTEYLKYKKGSGEDEHLYALHLGPTHVKLALACLSYLQAGCLDTTQVVLEERMKRDTHNSSQQYDFYEPTNEQGVRLKYPFYAYATRNWHVHVAKSTRAGASQHEVDLAIESFLANDKMRGLWLVLQWAILPQEKRRLQGITSLHIAARFGLTSYATVLINSKTGIDVDAKDAQGRTPIWWAASAGHEEIIRLLLSVDAEPNVDDSVEGLRPLHAAASRNHAGAISALLESGIDPLTEKTRVHSADHSYVGHTALMYACQMGHLEALNAFIPFLSDLDTIHCALVWSASAKRTHLIDRLIQLPGVDVNTKVRGQTALVQACRSGSRDTIIGLLNAGADPTLLCHDPGYDYGAFNSGSMEHESSEDRGLTALHALCSNMKSHMHMSHTNAKEWPELCALLAVLGEQVNQKNCDGSTALHIAVNIPVVVRLLLDAGADANALDDRGRTPLHLATSPDTISLLVEIGHAELNIQDFQGKTPLLGLLAYQSTAAVLKLLEFQPDLSIGDSRGDTALHTALENWDLQPEVIETLLAVGADPNARNISGQTPLMGLNIDEPAFLNLLEILLEAGGDINAKDSTGDTLLSKAIGRTISAESKYQSIIDALVNRGADIQTRDFAGKTLLHRLVATCKLGLLNRDDKVIGRLQYLLEKGLNFESTDYQGNTLLHEYSMHPDSSCSEPACSDAAEQLITLGIDPNQTNHSGRTALHIMAGSLLTRPDEAVFDLLLARTNINQRDNLGLSALHLASTLSEYNTKALLDAGADPTVKSYEGFTPLHLAARARQSNIIGQLLLALGTEGNKIVDVEDVRGYTPLYYACKSGRPETVRLLIDAGADASRKYLFDACADFEVEDALWKAEPRECRLDLAAGLTFTEKTRPISAFGPGHTSPYWDTLHRDQSTTRLEEILDMLMDNGGDIHSHILKNAISGGSSVNAGSEYTSACLSQAKKRSTVGSTSEATSEQIFALQVVTPADQDALDSLKENEANTGLVADFLKQRKYFAMQIMLQKGSNFLDGTDCSNFTQTCSPMEIFARNGFAYLLRQIGKLEADRHQEQGRWHAFGDASKPGLCNKSDSTIPKKRNWTHSFLLYEAAKNPLPNLDAMRVLVEELHVDVNETLYIQVYNSETQRHDQRPGGTVLHYLAKGLHWWHVYLAIPYLLSKGANVNALTYQGWSPLHIASGASNHCGLFRHEAAKAIILAGADVNATDLDGKSCLSYASSNVDMVRLMVASGARVGVDALFSAIDADSDKVLKALLSFGADPNAPRIITNKICDRYPLQYATRSLRYKADMKRNESKRNVLVRAIEVLLAHGADPFASWERESPSYLSRNNRYRIREDDFETRHSAVIKPDTNHNHTKYETVTLLHDALENGDIVHPILSVAGLDPNIRDAKGRTVLHAACLSKFGVYSPIDTVFTTAIERQSSSPSFLDHFLGLGADISKVDNDGRNVLHLSLNSIHYPYSSKKIPSVLELVKYVSGAHPYLLNQADIFGLTPLYLAVQLAVTVRDCSVVHSLLKAGADPFAVDRNMNTLLHIAAYNADSSRSFQDLCAKLLELGLDINAKNVFGETPIFNMNKVHPDPSNRLSMLKPLKEVGLTATEAIAMLEEAGADLFGTDSEGRGLLHIAASYSQLDAAASRFEALLKKGLDPTAEDNHKRTALDVAAAYNNKKILKLFNKDNIDNQLTAEEIQYENRREVWKLMAGL